MRRIRILFFDMEFANGKVPGSIYSIGYCVTDEHFALLTPPTDLLINPACEWNEYVAHHILAYPMEAVEESPQFSALYTQVRSLFESVDLAVGFAVNNDLRALRADCARYELEAFDFLWLDMERLCRSMEEHRDAHGLDGYFEAWCGGHPDNRHRSDGDAYATAQLLEAICREKHADAQMMVLAYSNCAGRALALRGRDKKKANDGKRKRSRFHRRKKKKEKEIVS